jgi:Na+/melibiose symporter-like transporter
VVETAMEKAPSEVRWYDYITININWFALTTRSQVLTALLIPLLVQQYVGDATKGTAVGTIRLWALMTALLFQALIGILTDRSTSRWGRRRPFILVGALGEIAVFLLIAWSASLSGMSGYWVFFGLVIASMLTSNLSQAATQPLISDLVPVSRRVIFSGIKAALELPIPLIFVSLVVAHMVEQGNLRGAIVALCLVLFACMVITLFVREVPLAGMPPPIDWQPFGRLLLMTAIFTALILGIREAQSYPLARLPDAGTGVMAVLPLLLGMSSMLVAIVAGVWLSARAGLGAVATKETGFTWWVVNRLAFLVGANNLASFMIFFLQDKFPQLEAEKAAGPVSQIMMYVGVFILVSALASDPLASRFGTKRLLIFSSVVAFCGAVIVVRASIMGTIFIGASLIGAAVGLFYSANWALGTQIVPPDKAGQYFGVANLAGAGAGAIGAYIGGPIGDAHGYVTLMAIYGGVMLLSIFALMGVRSKPTRGST